MSEARRNPVDELAEEFVERYRRGERPAISEYTQRHPDLAEEIHEVFPALVMIEEAGPEEPGPIHARAASITADGRPLEQLGDYHILRQIGRGGMGVVYEAVQEALGRHVALKVLPFTLSSDPTHLKRFRREARSAARLHHTNIVPVFDIGECRGIHYYAMQFIQGQGLDEILQELRRLRGLQISNNDASPIPTASGQRSFSSPDGDQSFGLANGLLTGQFRSEDWQEKNQEVGRQRSEVGGQKSEVGGQKSEVSQKSEPGALATGAPDVRPDSDSTLSLMGGSSEFSAQSEYHFYRSVARVGLQVAEALAYAHGQKVLHRDIKPSNLLLDLQGTIWVTDFGLAKEEESDDLTRTGDIVGTLRYMAPERFSGQADRRSDIYSLGMTLFELLTLRPAFEEMDRARLIQRITREEPPRPRKIDARIPRDLETMVLKAIAKEPDQRYRTTEEMAEDFRRYLGDRPIRARRTSVWEQTWRWARRNPAMSATASIAAGALAAAAVLGFSLALYQHSAAERLGVEQHQTIAALAQVRREQEQTQAALDEAEKQKRTAERLSATYALDQGISLCERGDVALGMLWLTHSLEILPDHAPELQRAIRANLAGWKRELRPLKALLKHEDAVWAIAFSPDGEIVLTGGWDKVGRLWNANTGAPVGPPMPHEGHIWSVAFGPDSHKGVIGADGGAQIWDVAKGERVGKPLQSLNSTGPVAFGPDGHSLFTAYGNGTVQRWDAATGEFRGDVCSHGTRVYCLDVSPDGRTIVTGGEDNCARLWDAVTGQAKGDPLCHQGVVRAVAFSHNGLRILTASHDGFGCLWNAATLKPIGLPLPHHDKVISVAFSHDDRLLLTGSADGTAQIWDADTCQRLGPPLKHRGQVSAVACSPKGTSIATGGTENVVRLWDMRQERWTRPEASLSHDTQVRGLAVSPDGRFLLTAGENGTAWVWDLSTRRLKGDPLPHRAFIRAVAVSPDGTVFLTGSDDCTAQLWDSATLQRVGQPIQHPNPIRAVAFSPDGKTILTGDVEGKVWRTDRTSPEITEVFFQHPAWVNGLAWSPDGKIIASAGLDKSALLWDARTGQPFGAPLEHGDAVWGVAFSHDSDLIVTGSWDGTARLWDVATQRPRGAPLQHGAKVEAVAISPDGHTIITGGLDGRARLWDAATSIPIGPPLIHRDMVLGATFQTDGQTVVTCGLDSAAHIWPVPSPVHGSVDDLIFQTQLLTGLRLESGGAAIVLDAKTWSRYRQLPVYNFMIALAPFHPEPVYQRGQLYDELGQLPKAVADYTSALRLYSGNQKMECQLRALRGRALWRLGQPAQAADDYQRALDLQFDQPLVLNTLAWLYVMGPARIRDAKRALPLARRAVALDSKNLNYVNTLGVIYYRLGRYFEAVSELEKSVVGNTVPALDLFPLAMCYAHLGNLAKARSSHDRAVKWLEDHKDQLWSWDAADIKILREEANQVLADSFEAESVHR